MRYFQIVRHKIWTKFIAVCVVGSVKLRLDTREDAAGCNATRLPLDIGTPSIRLNIRRRDTGGRQEGRHDGGPRNQQATAGS